MSSGTMKRKVHEQAPGGDTKSSVAMYGQIRTRRTARTMTAADGDRLPGVDEEGGCNPLADQTDMVRHVLGFTSSGDDYLFLALERRHKCCRGRSFERAAVMQSQRLSMG